MERLEKSLDFQRERFFFLYGSNKMDRFITYDYREVSILQALWELLRKDGFTCVLFYSHTGRIFFLDHDSRTHCLLPESSNTNPTSESQNKIRFKGPLGKKQSRLLSPSFQHQNIRAQNNNDNGVIHNIGDADALSLIDWVMKDTTQKSAVIIDQAHTCLTNNSLLGAQASRMGYWASLPSNNQNICILLFSCDDLKDEIEKNPGYLPIPEFRTLIDKNIERKKQKFILKIPNPTDKEVNRAIHLVRIADSKPFNWEQNQKMNKLISGDGRDILSWIRTLHNLDELALSKVSPFLESTLNDRSWKEVLEEMVGLVSVKRHIDLLESLMSDRKEREEEGLISPYDQPRFLHLAFLGNPGTGKTKVARLIGEMYRDLGMLSSGHVIEANYQTLTDEFEGGTAKRTREAVDQAYNGVLFIDEAYQLTSSQFGHEVIETLVPILENDRERLAVVFAGYTKPMQDFFESNEGINSRIPKENRIEFPDYQPEELLDILKIFLNQKGLSMTSDFDLVIREVITNMFNDRDVSSFGNARVMRNLADGIEAARAARRKVKQLPIEIPVEIEDLPKEARSFLPPPIPELDTVMGKLNRLIGLRSIKDAVKAMLDDLEVRPERKRLGQPISDSSLNIIFSGNPGTGKTTVAILMGDILRSVGKLRKGTVKDVRASDLIAGYLGQTAEKTEKVCQEALDGVLLIDEAYELTPTSEHDSYKKEAIGVLMNYLDHYSNRLVMILAGYPNQMASFINTNPGLTRRFIQFDFEDYSTNELLQILKLKCSDKVIDFPAEAEARALAYFEKRKIEFSLQQKPFINAGIVDELLAIMIANQNIRFKQSKDPEALKAFIPEDIPGEYRFPAAEQDQVNRVRYDIVSRLPTPREISIKEAMAAITFIEVDQGDSKGTGSGFIVSEDGHLLTAFHVVKGAKEILIRLNGKKNILPAKMVGFNEEWDIAVLRLPEDTTYPWIPIVKEGYLPDFNQKIAVLGFPRGDEMGDEITSVDGIISSIRQNGDIIQFNASVTHGNSGGPVIDQETGQVIGIVHGGLDDSHALMNFAISTEIIYREFGED